MIRNLLAIAAIAVLGAACAKSEPPPAAPAQPATVPAPPPEGSATEPLPGNPITFNLPPSAVDANPPGTPSYVIAPGDTVGRRNAQIPRPGGAPAF